MLRSRNRLLWGEDQSAIGTGHPVVPFPWTQHGLCHVPGHTAPPCPPRPACFLCPEPPQKRAHTPPWLPSASPSSKHSLCGSLGPGARLMAKMKRQKKPASPACKANPWGCKPMRKSAKRKGLRIERNSRCGVGKKGPLQGHWVTSLENFPLVTIYEAAKFKLGA